jgi:NhaP-type Na+/H+ or K+/H+ antiporter
MHGRFASSSSTDTNSTSTAVHHSAVVDIDLWVFIALLLSCVVIHMRESVKVPISAMLMLVGFVLRVAGDHIGMIGHAVVVMDNVDAETILLIFLPALIFECAFSMDWYLFKREFGQILLLASTTVVMSSIQTAIVIKYILGFDDVYGWYSALMLGAILSATDHVTVVEQLKEVNTDNHLETLIHGETLVNQGSVIVIFTVMMHGAIKSETFGEIVSQFFRQTVGGIGSGLGFGLVLSVWLNRLVNHPVLETLLTLLTAYLLFFTADATDLHVSGAISIVTFGLYMSAYGKTLITPAVEETVHNFWSLIGTCMQSLILIFGGTLIGKFLIDSHTLEYSDVGKAFALFVLLHAVRAITILIHWPLLRLMGYGCSARDMVVLVIGAVKGTISIALTLIVANETAFSQRLRDLVVLWAVGVSFLSVTLDSLILHFMLRCLGMKNMTNVQESMLVSVTSSILESTNEEMTEMKKDEEYAMVNWDYVQQRAGPETLFHNMLKVTKHGRELIKEKAPSSADASDIEKQLGESMNITDEDFILETRRRYYATLKGLYWDLFEVGKCFGPSALILMESANRGLDSENQVMNDWVYLEKKVYPVGKLKLIKTLSRLPILGNYFHNLEYSYITQAYDVGRAFIKAHDEAKELLEDMKIIKRAELFEEVMKEPHAQIELAQKFLSAHIVNVYPEVYIFVQTKQASYTLLCSEKAAIEEANEEGVITELEYSELIASVKRNIEVIERMTIPRMPTLIEMLKACYLFKELPLELLEQLASNTQEEDVEKGQFLFQEREEIRGIYVMIKGKVREAGKDFESEHFFGDIVGCQHLLPYFPRTVSTAEAVIGSQVVYVALGDIKELMKYEEFERMVWIQSAKRAIKVCRDSFGPLGQLDMTDLNSIFANCVLSKYAGDEKVPLVHGSLLLNGSLSNGCRAFAYVPGHEGQVVRAIRSSVILHFSEEISADIRSGNLMHLRKGLSKIDASPRVKLSSRGSVDSHVKLSPSGGKSPQSPLKIPKNRVAPVSFETEITHNVDLQPAESPVSPAKEHSMLARIRSKHNKARLNVTDSISQSSDRADDDPLAGNSSERGHRRV